MDERPIAPPPLPQATEPMYTGAEMMIYAAEAIRADRAAAEKKAGPVVQRQVVYLTDDSAWWVLKDRHCVQHRITLAWTPERAWIDSERNRELARKMRQHCRHWGVESERKLALELCDALDGGVSP